MQALKHTIERTPVLVDAGLIQVVGELITPADAGGMIVFGQGVGAARIRERSVAVAHSLARDGFATLRLELLTPDEEVVDRFTSGLRFDAALMADRLGCALRWLRRQTWIPRRPIGLFGVGTGAAAAALVAATMARDVASVVTCGGYPEMAKDALGQLRCPTLFIAGADDGELIVRNTRAMRQMRAPTAMHLVRKAGRLFEAPGGLWGVIEAASSWFATHLVATVEQAAA